MELQFQSRDRGHLRDIACDVKEYIHQNQHDANVHSREQFIHNLLSNILNKHRKLPSNVGTRYKYDQVQGQACSMCDHWIRKGMMVRKLWCNHVFHARCADNWLICNELRCPECNIVSLKNISETIPNDGEKTEDATTK